MIEKEMLKVEDHEQNWYCLTLMYNKSKWAGKMVKHCGYKRDY